MTAFNQLPASQIEAAKIKTLWWQEKGLSETSSGYGDKLTTRYMVRISNRWHRVYCACFSNTGTLYVIKKGRKFYIDSIDIEEKLQSEK